MLHPSLVERITRSLAYMLRHQPEQFDLELDEYGYADLDDVVSALNERLGEPVEPEDVVQAVDGGDRPRYEIREGRIRALYGHSIQVKPGEPGKPPQLLYVGISRSDAERASRYGLRPGRRSFLHLALTPEDALETGRRASRDYAVVTVNALDAWEEGINFYDRKSLFLSDPIPTHFLHVGEVQTDGYGEEAGGERGERPPRSDAPRHEDRSESPRRREWRDRPVERAPERPAEREPARPAASHPGEGRPERPAGEGRGDRHGYRGRERHGRGDRRGDSRGPRDDRYPPRTERHEPARMPRAREEQRPPPPGPREPARPSAPPPAPRAPSSSPDTFGMGVFEAEASGRSSARAPEPRATPAAKREETPSAPADKPREPARAEADDSGFGAGL